MGLLLDILYIFAGIFAFPFYYLRLRRTGRGFGQIFARLKAPPRLDPSRYRVWVHAVSVGEVLAAVPFIDALFEIVSSDVELVLSVGTTTGMEVARQRLPHVRAFYCPPDLSLLTKRAFWRVEPSVLVLMELELWPNMLREASRRKIPVIVVNGRMSERSEKGYRRLGWFFRSMTRRVSMFGVQHGAYARRLLGLGIPEDRVAVLGNVKYDLVLKQPSPEKIERLRKLLGFAKGEPVFLAGSTHPGEDEIIIAVYRRLKRTFRSLRLVIVPRHPGRARDVAALLDGVPCVFRSQLEADKSAALHGELSDRVVIGDVMGELAALYYCASVVFVGGSLVEHGGQNPLEPAAAGRPMVFGPHMFNFAAEADILTKAGAAVEVKDPDEMHKTLSDWLSNSASAAEKGLAGYEAISHHKGAAVRYAEVVRKYLAEMMTS